MEPKLTTLDARIAAGIEVRTTNREEMSPATAKIPGLWRRFYQERLLEKIPSKKPTGMPMGVYSKYKTDHTGPYYLLAGTEVSSLDELPGGMTGVTISGGKYLVFTAQGPMPKILIETWMTIWDYFSKSSIYKRAYTTDFELYRGEDAVDIHIAIK
jgi:predicted transcriptional regulator YdeE